MNQFARDTLKTTRSDQAPPPKKYAVCLLNDDFTPMQFVVQILQEIFYLPHDTAETVMWQVHREGKGRCGPYSLDVARTKCAQVNTAAQNAGHPLHCVVEESA